ncbi:lytic murein transglycosylase [Gymnodinialimonas ceratoperidinii]|uniref:Lytic murein transglycosylase n=2 Tax=Gymnodinialimonas ceratoperidinii TaxID=2856823 RepID=A0A8F6U0X0_9RHOB|nr:lytic murein transglycosylase [Gymnodinialimonas ceratoperidinii]
MSVEVLPEPASAPAAAPVAEAVPTETPGEAVTADTIGTRSPDGESLLAVLTSPLPRARGEVPAEFVARAAVLRAEAEASAAQEAAARPLDTDDPAFRAWITDFRDRALAAGISPATFTRAFDGLDLNARVLDRDRNQAEFSRTLWEYLDTAVSSTRIRNGQEMRSEWRTTLVRIEEQYQVEAEVVLAVWGLESAYGAARGNIPVVEAMASLAYDGRRQEFFEQQLIAALQIIEAGDTSVGNMTGSWAGAMGHTQFMPTSYLEFAQDFDGDGRRNIWGDTPIDALASTAHYLAEHGWVYGQPWGLEVRLPDGFDYRLAGEQENIGVAFWNNLGVRLVNGDPIPDHGRASILLPGGAEGVALVTFGNFRVIERYNPADAYVIAIGHLSDRIDGGRGFEAGWPRGDRALTFAEREELQRLLLAAGHYNEEIDGIVGPITIAAVRSYQAAAGVTPDGYASPRLLERLRSS